MAVETLLIRLATVMLLLDWRFRLASVTTREEAVRVERFKLPDWSIVTRLVPLEFWKLAKAEAWLEVALTIKIGVVEARE